MDAYCLKSIKMVLAWRPPCSRSLSHQIHTSTCAQIRTPHSGLKCYVQKPTHARKSALSQTLASQLVPALISPWKRIPSQQDAFSLFTVNRPKPYQQLITARQTHKVQPLETKDSITKFLDVATVFICAIRHLFRVIFFFFLVTFNCIFVILSNWCLICLRKLGQLDNTCKYYGSSPPFSFRDRSDEFTTPKAVMCQHAVQLCSLFPELPAWQI